MNIAIACIRLTRRTIAASLAIVVVSANLAFAPQAGAQTAPAAAAGVPAAPATPGDALAWSFHAAQPNGDQGWTAERGTITQVDGELRIQPDANRRVVLLSPPALPEAAGHAGEFVLGITGTGLQRVRIQARRDARGGWITIADASGAALREAPDGYAIRRNAGARDAPVERLRVELHFRTTNPRALQRIELVSSPR